MIVRIKKYVGHNEVEEAVKKIKGSIEEGGRKNDMLCYSPL